MRKGKDYSEEEYKDATELDDDNEIMNNRTEDEDEYKTEDENVDEFVAEDEDELVAETQVKRCQIGYQSVINQVPD
ncbi:hypothetical protein RclHR1_00880013 [Rhizophagus clarus]|uniref:Uncharacterized protein n=1 Tax=Rhizophagus clarus TaxID=94130 RepID=A0A2Z6SP43_9GLOM|nr:hypothetical protein RclHR1_00880013 [Rhizophagus clarus]GES80467.1 hypothetical protein RCL_jg10792.t1 [Rhizophagus clarus]